MITVTDIECTKTEFGVELRSLMRSSDDRFDDFHLWWRYPDQYYEQVSMTANAHVAAGLLPAMCLGQDLKVEGKVSRRMLEGTEKYMEVINGWWPECKRIKVIHDECDETIENGRHIGTFFSGGLDSFYTLLKNDESDTPASDKISHLIFIRGFDVGLGNDDLYERALTGVENVAKELDKKVVQVSTNLMELSRQMADWNMYHGPAMISVALGLGGLFRKVYVPASYPRRDLFPWGSHPLTDPHWSTESLDVVHDGCEAGRIEKIMWQVGKSQVALDNLRVCTQQRPGRYNCGVCEKCIRTMLNLEIAGVLDKCGSFPRRYTCSDLRNLDLSSESARVFAFENCEALVTTGGDPRVIRALKFSMDRGALWQLRHLTRRIAKRTARNINKHILHR